MDKKKSVLDVIFLVQAILFSGLYLYSKINKWNIMEQMTIFLYPIFQGAILILMGLSFFASCIYFMFKLKKEKKIIWVPVFIGGMTFLISAIFFNEMKLREYNFQKYKDEREKVVEMVLQGYLKPDENGCIDLPPKFHDEKLSRDGTVYMVKHSSQYGVYFCTFSGLLESSSGFVCFIDNNYKTDNLSPDEIVLIEPLQESWYYCSTN